MATTQTAARNVTVGNTITYSTNGKRQAMYVEAIRPSSTGRSLVFTGNKARVRDGVRLQAFATALIGADLAVMVH